MNKKNITIIIAVIIILILGLIIFGSIQKAEEKKQKQTIQNYIECISQKDYEAMYNMVAEMNTSKEDFIKRNQNIYEGIGAENIKIEISEINKAGGKIQINYTESMMTEAGKISFQNTTSLIKKGKEYKINWSSHDIFPQLGDTDKVRISTLKATRGSILDRNGEKIAYDGKAFSVGIVPGKLGEEKEKNIKKIAEILDVSEEAINEDLNASYVKEDTFVPVKKIAQGDSNLKQQLLEIPGVMLNDVDARVYSLGKEAAHLIGYVQPINKEELEKNEGKGYTTSSLIGKTGIELAYEETLRGIDGAEIYIEDSEGNKNVQLAIQQKQDGKDVQLTIDSELQQKTYEQLKNDKGLFVIMEPDTGELLALVSTPTYDSNEFALGMTTKRWNELNEDKSKPLYNRFLQSYCPGSTFKPITGAIGLSTEKITTEDEAEYTNKSWQKDNSWGNYSITTLTAYNGRKNLQNAIIHSDNIFFGQAALKIGGDIFAENLNKLGFNEQLEFPLTLKKSTYTNNSNNKFSTEIKLADTGYGQGDLLINPIHMAAMYGTIANQGNMLKPVIEYNKETAGQGTVLKENVLTKEAIQEIEKDLIQVVENEEGTAHDMKIDGLTIAGKTGTAELKASAEDKESGTLGWFNCYTLNRTNKNLLIVGMVENAQDNSDGGSHYVIKKIRNIIL